VRSSFVTCGSDVGERERQRERVTGERGEREREREKRDERDKISAHYGFVTC
jgi:hypothetical protein